MRNLSIIVLVGFAVSACTTTNNYSDTLEQKLAGKSPQEKKMVLAQECSQEIQTGLKPKDEANIRHFERMQKICEEMTGQSVPLDIPVSKK